MEIETKIVTEDIIKGTLGKPIFTMYTKNNSYCAEIGYPVLKDEQEVDRLNISIIAEEWNIFWSNFSSGKYLIEVLKEKYDLSTLVIPSDIENWFVNMV